MLNFTEMKETKAKSKTAAAKKQKQEEGDEYAAIAMALYSYLGGQTTGRAT